MGFAQLLQEVKAVEIAGIKVELKKLPLGFMQCYIQRSIEVKEIKGPEKARANSELQGEFLYNGIKKWSLQKEDGTPATLDLETCFELCKDHAGFADSLIGEIIAFNELLPELKKN
jgi:hypothetical protein